MTLSVNLTDEHGSMRQNIRQKIKDVKNARQEIKKLTKEHSENIAHLEEDQKDFAKSIAEWLHHNKSKSLCTLKSLTEHSIDIENADSKNLFEDFLYLYYDSLDRPRLVQPNEFVAYRVMENGDIEELIDYTEQELDTYLMEIHKSDEAWKSSFSNAGLIERLYELSIPVTYVLFHLDSGRKVSQGLKRGFEPESILVFEKEDVDEYIVNDADLLIEVLELIYQE